MPKPRSTKDFDRLSQKARADFKKFEELPNVGKATAGDFRLLGFETPQDLIGQDPYVLYQTLCDKTACIHDRCVIDVFIATIRFMEGESAKGWWEYTEQRKAHLETRTKQA